MALNGSDTVSGSDNAVSSSGNQLCPSAILVSNISNNDPDTYSAVLKVVHMSVLTALMLFTLVGNGLMIVVLSTRRQLKSVTNMFVISLSVSDLLVAMLVIPINFAVPTSLFDGYTTCIYCGSLTLTLCLASITNIFAVTIDRYIAIMDPLKYPVRMTRRRAAMAIAIAWIYAVLLGMLPALGWRARHSTCTRGETYSPYYVLVVVWSGFIVPLWGTGALYWRILVEARRHVRLHRVMSSSSFCAEHLQCESSVRSDESCNNSNRDNTRKHSRTPRSLAVLPRRHMSGTDNGVGRRRKFVTVAIMLMYFELSWMPVFVSMLIDAFITPIWLPAWAHRFMGILAFMNCAMDPIIYGYRNKDIRRAFTNMVKAVCKRNARQDMYMDILANHPIPRNASRVKFFE